MKTKISDLKTNDIVALKNGYIDIFTNRQRGCGAIILEKHHHVHDYQIDWQKTNELNNNKMKELKIEAKEKAKEIFEKFYYANQPYTFEIKVAKELAKIHINGLIEYAKTFGDVTDLDIKEFNEVLKEIDNI